MKLLRKVNFSMSARRSAIQLERIEVHTRIDFLKVDLAHLLLVGLLIGYKQRLGLQVKRCEEGGPYRERLDEDATYVGLVERR